MRVGVGWIPTVIVIVRVSVVVVRWISVVVVIIIAEVPVRGPVVITIGASGRIIAARIYGDGWRRCCNKPAKLTVNVAVVNLDLNLQLMPDDRQRHCEYQLPGIVAVDHAHRRVS